jgi:hypothetical protein
MIMQAERQIPLILKLDVSGQPVEWIHWREAAAQYFRETVRWGLGARKIPLYGGWRRDTGERSVLHIDTIIAVDDHSRKRGRSLVPRLCRRTLYQRDRGICMYCAHTVGYHQMEVEHVIPLSRGGRTVWGNVVVACHRCNHRKDARTPEEAHMNLLAVPYAPNVAEYLILSNRRILADQMEFLKPLVPLRRAS